MEFDRCLFSLLYESCICDIVPNINSYGSIITVDPRVSNGSSGFIVKTELSRRVPEDFRHFVIVTHEQDIAASITFKSENKHLSNSMSA
jgi:Ni,Fe-hydrogenase maturation factor